MQKSGTLEASKAPLKGLWADNFISIVISAPELTKKILFEAKSSRTLRKVPLSEYRGRFTDIAIAKSQNGTDFAFFIIFHVPYHDLQNFEKIQKLKVKGFFNQIL